jgi:NAD(P)-dependent dehydrogenase (short-subunit alcohol dehydrogenase family)
MPSVGISPGAMALSRMAYRPHSEASDIVMACTAALLIAEGMSKRLNPSDVPGERTARINPMNRVGRMEELQNLATFLLSDGCAWLNGETIAMDGGQHLATGGNFYELRQWTDAQWEAARAAIKAQNEKDRAQRGG